MADKTFLRSILQSLKNFGSILPMLAAVILTMGLFQTYITEDMLKSIFSGNTLGDTLIGTLAGGVSVGNPVVSYILGGELLSSGISLYAVTAFILSWVSIGVVQLPLEWQLFGRRFTIVRNLLSVIGAIVVTFLTVMTLKVFS
ncbi:permease [Sulfurimonas sp. HSL-1716]|uniref:permease n=1 Tax=Hydrocurvibacter sulfurireducens TaxID=3131937 RepID=UPI0031F776CC